MEPASVTIKKKRALRLAFSVVVGLRFSLSCGGPWCGHRSDDDRPVAQARRGADGRQKGRERGYYHLHRQLDDALLLHTIFVFFRGMRLLGGAVARGTASLEAGGARLLCCGIVCP